MALLTTQPVGLTALLPTFTAVSASDTFVPDSRTFLWMVNSGGSTNNVVVTVAAGHPPGMTILNVSTSFPAGESRIMGPFPAQFFANPTTGLCTMTNSFTTTVFIAIFKLTLA